MQKAHPCAESHQNRCGRLGCRRLEEPEKITGVHCKVAYVQKLNRSANVDEILCIDRHPDIINCANFCDYRLKGSGVVGIKFCHFAHRFAVVLTDTSPLSRSLSRYYESLTVIVPQLAVRRCSAYT